MAYVGTPIDTRNTFQSLQGKRFNGDGSTTAFTLDVAPSSTLDIEVFVGNVRQDPNSAYTVSGTTLSFTGAPPSGTNNIYVVHQAKSVGTIDVPAGGVAADSLATSVLTGQTDIGADIADADLFLVDDGAGGTLRKTAASRIKTYAGFSASDITGATELAENPAKTDEIVISDAGTLKRLDLTHLYPTPIAHARMDTVPDCQSGVDLKLNLDTEIIDSDGKFDTSNNRFTPGVAGYYVIFGMVEFVNVAHTCAVAIRKNGSADNSNIGRGIHGEPNDSTDETSPSIMSIVYLDADDYVEIWCDQSSGSTRQIRYGRMLAFKLNHGGTAS